MNRERANSLLDAYGGSPENWPTEHREALAQFLDGCADGDALLREAKLLDEALAAFQPPHVDLTVQIMSAIPRSALDRLVEWLVPTPPSLWWRPAAAAMLPLALGIGIGALSPDFLSPVDTNDWASVEAQLVSTTLSGTWYE